MKVRNLYAPHLAGHTLSRLAKAMRPNLSPQNSSNPFHRWLVTHGNADAYAYRAPPSGNQHEAAFTIK